MVMSRIRKGLREREGLVAMFALLGTCSTCKNS